MRTTLLVANDVGRARALGGLFDVEFNILSFFEVRAANVLHVKENVFVRVLCRNETVTASIVEEIHSSVCHYDSTCAPPETRVPSVAVPWAAAVCEFSCNRNARHSAHGRTCGRERRFCDDRRMRLDQTPYLIDTDRGVTMYESNDIVEYLEEHDE